jgi:hypothetical protein
MLLHLPRQEGYQRGQIRKAHGSSAARRKHHSLPAPVIPEGTDLSLHSTGELAAVARAMNTRPRKTLGWKTPIEVLDQFLGQQYGDRVATTG